MHTQGRIAHEGNMDLARAVVRLVLIESVAAIVLRETGAEPDRFAERHVLQEPVRSAGQSAGQPVGRQRQDRALQVVFGIPIAQPTAEEHGKDSFNVVLIKLSRDTVMISVRVAKASYAGEAPGPAAVSP